MNELWFKANDMNSTVTNCPETLPLTALMVTIHAGIMVVLSITMVQGYSQIFISFLRFEELVTSLDTALQRSQSGKQLCVL